MVRILDPDPPRDALELLASRIARVKVTLDVPEETGHLAENVFGRRKAEQVSFGSVEIARRPFDQWSVPEYAEPSGRVQLLDAGRLSSSFEVVLDRLEENGVVRVLILGSPPMCRSGS